MIWAAGALTDLTGLIIALASAYGAVLGVVALVTACQVLSARRPPRRGRGVVVPPGGATAPDVNHGGPHGSPEAVADINGGAMDGFVAEARKASGVCEADGSACPPDASVDVLGYHDASTIPNYWAYAKNFVLNDHMFQPVVSWSLPTHLFLVSEWSAKCSRQGDPQSCVNALNAPDQTPKPGTFATTIAGR